MTHLLHAAAHRVVAVIEVDSVGRLAAALEGARRRGVAQVGDDGAALVFKALDTDEVHELLRRIGW